MKNFANDDSDRNFESADACAHDSPVTATGISDVERSRETNTSRNRADSTGSHEADAGQPPADASGDAEETENGKEIELTEEMINAGVFAMYDRRNDDMFCSSEERIRRIYFAMIRAR
jgi:hypothetical protein